MAPENGLFLALTIHNCPTGTAFTAKVITVYEDSTVEDAVYSFTVAEADLPTLVSGDYETDKDVVDFDTLIAES